MIPSADLMLAVSDWNAGKSLRVLELGHSNRMKDDPRGGQVIDTSKFLYRHQVRAYEFLFKIVSFFSTGPDPMPAHEGYLSVCEMISQDFPALTTEERDGAEGLAWKALLIGWRKAIDGYPDSSYVEVKRVVVQ